MYHIQTHDNELLKREPRIPTQLVLISSEITRPDEKRLQNLPIDFQSYQPLVDAIPTRLRPYAVRRSEKDGRKILTFL
jgi:hypothetical protein